KTLLSSKARLAMVPMQDLLALGEESRMNTPALVSEVNWSWRLAPALLTEELTARLKATLQVAKR
ncbi:MAG: 4-alpha-glucanotransferase, partial [Clostridia bacterium]|nr:4-alpha-glucanotransferase [Clostridia bacterium]